MRIDAVKAKIHHIGDVSGSLNCESVISHNYNILSQNVNNVKYLFAIKNHEILYVWCARKEVIALVMDYFIGL